MEAAIWLSFWVEDYSEELIFKSSKVLLQSNGECVWDDGFQLLGASQLENRHFRFKFFQHVNEARLFWFFKDILCSTLICGSLGFSITGCSTPSLKRKTIKTTGKCQEWEFDMKLRIEIQYDSKIQYLDMTYADYNISQVATYIDNVLQLNAMKIARNRERHRIVCLIEIHKGAKTQEIIYLGRAQKIETTTGYNPRDRVYTWDLNLEYEKPAFPGFCIKRKEFWSFHKEQHDDMLRLKIYNQPLSARIVDGHSIEQYSVDNDDYSNLLKGQPIYVEEEQAVILRFFNMEENNGNPVEIYLKRNNFAPKGVETDRKRSQRRLESVQIRTLDYEINKYLTVFIEYMLSSKNIIIHSIKLLAKNYLDSLLFGKLIQFSRMNSM